MAIIGNILWFLVGGWELAIFWLFMAGFFFWSPHFRKAFLQITKFCILPFGSVIIKESDMGTSKNISKKELDKIKILNLIWLFFGIIGAFYMAVIGLWVILAGLFLTIIIITAPIGIMYMSIGVALMRMAPLILKPVGMVVVSKKKAQAVASAQEMIKLQVKNELVNKNNNN